MKSSQSKSNVMSQEILIKNENNFFTNETLNQRVGENLTFTLKCRKYCSQQKFQIVYLTYYNGEIYFNNTLQKFLANLGREQVLRYE